MYRNSLFYFIAAGLIIYSKTDHMAKYQRMLLRIFMYYRMVMDNLQDI